MTTDLAKRRKGMIAVRPSYAEAYPEAVIKIGDYWYTPSVSAREAREGDISEIRARKLIERPPELEALPEEVKFPEPIPRYEFSPAMGRLLAEYGSIEAIPEEELRLIEEFEPVELLPAEMEPFLTEMSFPPEMVITTDMPVSERIRAEQERARNPEIVARIEQAQDDFLDSLQEIGRTPDTEAILRQLGATEEQIGEFFPTITEELKREETKFWAERYAGMSLPEKALNSFIAGVGDILSTSGGIARRFGYEGVGATLSSMGSDLQRFVPPRETEEFEFADLLDPEFYAEKVTRTIPFALSLAPLAIGGFYGGVAIAGAAGLGTIGSMIVGGLTGAALSRPAESLLEAGAQYDDAIARGKTEKEAQEEFDQVFRDNMTLAGADAFEIAIALAPTPKWVPLSLVKSGLVRTARIGGKMVIVGLSEGGEEIYQDMIQRRARGEEWQWDPISKEVFAIGSIMGMGMGLGGDVVQSVVNRSKDKMPTDLNREFVNHVNGFLEDGFTTEQAELRALNEIAKILEGRRIISEAIEATKKEIPVKPPVEVPAVPEAVPEVTKGTEPGGIKTLEIKDKGGEVISSLAFTETKESIILDSMGTVETARQQGLQTRLWEELSLSGKPIETRAGTLTAAGERFIQSLENKGFNVVGTTTPEGMTQYAITKPPAVEVVPEVIDERAERISKIRQSEEYQTIEKEWRRVQEEKGVGSPEALALRDKLVSLEEVKPPAVPEVVEAPPPTIPPVAKPEVFMTQEQWETIPETSRAKALAEAGLDRELKEKSWGELNILEKDALGESYIAPDKPLLDEQRTEIERLAKAKLLMTEEGKAKPGLTNLMKGLVGKNKIQNLTQSEADTVIEALGLLEVKYGRAPKIPTTVGLITKEFADKIPHLKEIGILEKYRPTRQVFEKMGLRVEVFEAAFKAETEIYEDLMAFRREAKEIKALVGKDPERRRLVFRELENPGSQVGLTFNEKRAINWFRKHFDDWANKLNLPAEKRRQNYVTHIFEEEIKQELATKHPLDPTLIKALDWITPKTVFNPFLQRRLGQTMGLKEDPFAAASAYEARALKVYHYEPLIQKIRVYEKYLPPHSARYLRNFITRITGRPLTIDRELNQTLNEFADTIKGLPGGEEFARHLTRGNAGGLFAYNFTSSLYFLWLGFKPTSAIRNLGQHSLALAEVGPINFAQGIGLRFTEEGKLALKESLVLRSRRQAFVPGIDASFASRWTDKFRETALWMFRQADRQNVSDAFLSGYAEMKSKFPEAGREWWIKRGDEVAADTQYIYTQLGGAAWSQSAMGRTLSILTTWPENWVELMTRYVKGSPSYVINDYVKTTGQPIPAENWLLKRKALLLYLAIIAAGYMIKEETRLKAWEYTGLTSLRYLADLASGEFPALQYPGAVMDVIVGFLTDDERRLKTGWAQLKPVNLMGIVRQLDNVVSGEKDWLTLFFYLEGRDYPIKQLKNKWEKGWRDYEALETAKERDDYRKNNPLIEAQMFITSKFTTLTTEKARQEVLRLIEEHKLDTELIDGYEKVFGVDTNVELSKFKKSIGTFETPEVGKEIDYITTSDFASEVNRLEKIMGRYKLEKDGNTLAIQYLRAKDLWEPYYDLPEDGRRLYRQQFPELEAQLYLWGKVSSFINPQSAEILLGLMEKYGIPPEGVPAFLGNPEKYDELFTQKFELKKTWFDLDTEYENYGNSESPLYIEDDEARKEAREKLKEDNPNWVADMRRIEAIDNDASPETIESWADRGKTIDEFGAGSSEAKVWLIDNPEVHKWALEQKLLTDDGGDWNEPVLRINVEMAQAVEGSVRYLMLKRRKEAYEKGIPEALIDNYVAYYDLPVAGYRQERFLIEHPDLAKAIGLEVPERVPSIEYDILLEKEDRTPEDNLRMDAYKLLFPDKLIETYVEYYSLERKGYEDDWFLMEHPEFYKTAKELRDWEKRDFSKVPTKAVYGKYLVYGGLPLGQTRLDYRAQNLDLNEWLISVKGYKPLEDRGSKETDLSSWEKLAEEIAKGLERVKKLRE